MYCYYSQVPNNYLEQDFYQISNNIESFEEHYYDTPDFFLARIEKKWLVLHENLITGQIEWFFKKNEKHFGIKLSNFDLIYEIFEKYKRNINELKKFATISINQAKQSDNVWINFCFWQKENNSFYYICKITIVSDDFEEINKQKKYLILSPIFALLSQKPEAKQLVFTHKEEKLAKKLQIYSTYPFLQKFKEDFPDLLLSTKKEN